MDEVSNLENTDQEKRISDLERELDKKETTISILKTGIKILENKSIPGKKINIGADEWNRMMVSYRNLKIELERIIGKEKVEEIINKQ